MTGDAQTAIVWLRLYEVTGVDRYREAAQAVNHYLASTQDLASKDEGIRGGVKGSQPIWGEYGSFEYLNWAAKFYADALMLELKTLERSDARGTLDRACDEARASQAS